MVIRALIFIFFLCLVGDAFSTDRNFFIARKIVDEIPYFRSENFKKIKIKEFSSGSDIMIFEARGESARSSGFCYMKYVGFEARKEHQDILIDSESKDEGFELYSSSCSVLSGDKVFFSKEISLYKAKKIFNILKMFRGGGDGCAALKDSKYSLGRAVNINNSRVVLDGNKYKASLLGEKIGESWPEIFIGGDLGSPTINCFMPI